MNPALLTGIFSIGEKLINHWFPDAEESDKRKAELMVLLQEGEIKRFLGAVSIIQEEAKSEHWLVAAWRPITMLTFVAIIANNYILYPYLSLFWTNAPVLALPEQMWSLLQIGLGGYVVGRSAEKIVKSYNEKSHQ